MQSHPAKSLSPIQNPLQMACPSIYVCVTFKSVSLARFIFKWLYATVQATTEPFCKSIWHCMQCKLTYFVFECTLMLAAILFLMSFRLWNFKFGMQNKLFVTRMRSHSNWKKRKLSNSSRIIDTYLICIFSFVVFISKHYLIFSSSSGSTRYRFQ